jgi:hypothetical protein
VLLSLAPVRLVELDHAMTAMPISAPLVSSDPIDSLIFYMRSLVMQLADLIRKPRSIVETLGISNAHKSRPRFRLRTFNTSRALMIPLHGSGAKVV